MLQKLVNSLKKKVDLLQAKMIQKNAEIQTNLCKVQGTHSRLEM